MDEKQPFLAHLEELRSRLIVCAIAIGVGFAISYVFSKQIFRLLILPLTRVLPAESRLIFTNLPEMFITYIKVSLVAGITLAIPVIFYELWMFLAPALYQREKRYLVPFVLFSSILFVLGALFGYLVVFPYGFKFFISFATEDIQALPSVKQYFSFAIRLLLAFGLVFEMPIVVLFLTKLGLITPAAMKRFRKFAILCAFILSAILTPPDVATQFMMALPLIVLYELSIYLSRLVYRKRQDSPHEQGPESSGSGPM
jgi:sec-independent protein translocase protein TatC